MIPRQRGNHHAQAANIPMILLKMDRDTANPDKIKLFKRDEYSREEWGGKYQCQNFAKNVTNIDNYLRKFFLKLRC